MTLSPSPGRKVDSDNVSCPLDDEFCRGSMIVPDDVYAKAPELVDAVGREVAALTGLRGGVSGVRGGRTEEGVYGPARNDNGNVFPLNPSSLNGVSPNFETELPAE